MRSKPVLCLLMTAMLIGAPASANAANWFSRFTHSTIVNHGNSWETQQRGYYAAGGFSIRTPVDRSTLFNITPPRIEIGCGGIDAFWGGFSFLNPEFLVQKLKNILQAAPAYAFDLALTHLCQSCSNIMKSLEAIASELNALALDDCKASQALVNKGGAFLASAIGINSEQGSNPGGGGDFLNSMLSATDNFLQGAASGISDFRKSVNSMMDYKYGCNNNPSFSSNEECRRFFSAEGTLWSKVLELSKKRDGTYAIDGQFITLARSIYGDVHFIPPDDKKANPGSSSKAKVGRVEKGKVCEDSIDALISAMADPDADANGVKIRVWNETAGECADAQPGTVLEESMLVGKRASAAMMDILNAMHSGGTLKADTLKIINESVVPVYTALNILNLRSQPKREITSPSEFSAEEMAMAKMIAAGHVLYIMDSLHAKVMDVLADAKVFYAQVSESSAFSPAQIDEAFRTMNDRGSLVRFSITARIDEARIKYQAAIDGIVKFMSLKQTYQSLVNARIIN